MNWALIGIVEGKGAKIKQTLLNFRQTHPSFQNEEEQIAGKYSTQKVKKGLDAPLTPEERNICFLVKNLKIGGVIFYGL